MNKPRQLKVGNEHFKTWFTNLDPVTRVEKMSIIVKTQASAGLKGSLIKASLAQLSQRCVVMLIRLTDKEINIAKSRKPEEIPAATFGSKIQLEDSMKSKIKQLHSSKRSVDKSMNTEKYKKQILFKCPLNFQPEIQNENKLRCESLKSSKKHLVNKKNISKHFSNLKSKKVKEKFRELFGDDNEFPVHILGKEGDSIENEGDRLINNYMSTTVNVNIYNSMDHDSNKNRFPVVKRKSDSESTVLKGTVPVNKKLRIDVSLSNEKPSINDSSEISSKSGFSSDIVSDEKSMKDKRRQKPHKISKSGHKNKQNISKANKISKLSINSNDNSEDDPSIKELWSIFGMESPKDRSATINKSHPFDDKNITLHGTTDSANPVSITFNECQSTISFQAAKELLVQPSLLTEGYISENACSTEMESDLQEPVINENNATQEMENCIKIVETYSLANEVSESHDNGFAEKPPEPQMGNESMRSPDHQSNVDLTDSNAKQIKNLDESSKVGTIRVKNLGLLMEPQKDKAVPMKDCMLGPFEGSSQMDKIGTDDPQHCSLKKDNTTKTDPKRYEECFFNIYKHYFDDLVESKIPKLGELLHLAVADELRRNDRIKRAEQLSSDDLIKEEKLRAEKDYNDMMRIRGQEFSPLCELIISRFDQTSKLTLFNALFCRIMRHAEQIDQANKYHVFEAKTVIKTMLEKHQFKDNDVFGFLQSSSQFQQLMEEIRNLIDKFEKLETNKQPVVTLNTSSIYDVLNPPNVSVSQNGINTAQVEKMTTSSDRENRSQVLNIARNPSQLHTLRPPNPILQKHLIPVRNNAPSRIIANSSNIQSRFLSTTGPLQLSHPGIAFVSFPHSSASSAQATMPLPQSVNRLWSVQKQNINPSRLISSSTATVANSNMMTKSSESSLICGKPVYFSSVSTQYHPNTRLQTLGSQPLSSDAPTHVIINTIVPDKPKLSIRNLVSKENHSQLLGLLHKTPKETVNSPSVIVKTPYVPQHVIPVSETPNSRALEVPSTAAVLNKCATSLAENTSTPDSDNLALSTQSTLPSSSHCHPFVKRMPISGKIKMFFENTTSMR